MKEDRIPFLRMVAKQENSPILIIVKPKRFHGSSIGIIIGALLFITISVVAAWGDAQSITFDNKWMNAEHLSTLSCPVVITENETGTISAALTNETNRSMLNRMRAVITSGSEEPDKIEYEFTVEPDETRTLTWPITATYAGTNNYILVRVHQVATYATPLKNASCGIYVARISFLTGTQLILVWMGMAILISGVSLLIWGLFCSPRGWQNPGFKRWLFFTCVSLLLALISLAGYWGITTLLAIVWIMQAIEIILYFSSHKIPPEPIDK